MTWRCNSATGPAWGTISRYVVHKITAIISGNFLSRVGVGNEVQAVENTGIKTSLQEVHRRGASQAVGRNLLVFQRRTLLRDRVAMLVDIFYIILEGSGCFVPDSLKFGTDESQ